MPRLYVRSIPRQPPLIRVSPSDLRAPFTLRYKPRSARLYSGRTGIFVPFVLSRLRSSRIEAQTHDIFDFLRYVKRTGALKAADRSLVGMNDPEAERYNALP